MSRGAKLIWISILTLMLLSIMCAVAQACWRRARSHCCYHTQAYALLEAKYQAVLEERDQLEENLAVLQAQYDEMKDQYDSLNATYDTLSEEHEMLLQAHINLSKRFEQLKKAYDELLQGQLPPDIAKYREAIKAFQEAHQILLNLE